MITVIVPVYGAAPVVQACLASLHGEIDAEHQLLVIDDASPDPKMPSLLTEALKPFGAYARLILQTENRGFVGTVNHGIAESSGDVILLNSDTVASPGFVHRISECAGTDARIATITPFSNNAEICSFPELCQAGPIPDNLQAIARAAATLPNQGFIDLPTGVGFCMWIRRAALHALGDFDQATFGKGYGEENDFCQRALAFGWRNVLCHRAYVAHRGGESFAATTHRPNGEALRRLLSRYPRYNQQVADFIAADPPKAWRTQLAAALSI